MAAAKPAFRSVKGRAQTPAPRKTLLSPFTSQSASASSQFSPDSAKARVPPRVPQRRTRIEQLFPIEIPPGHAVTVETSIGAVETVAEEDAEDYAARGLPSLLDLGYDEETAYGMLLEQLTETRDLWVQRQIERREAAQNRQVIPAPLGSEFPFLMPLEETGDEAPFPSADAEDADDIDDADAADVVEDADAALSFPSRARNDGSLSYPRRRVASPRQPAKRARTDDRVDVRAPAAEPRRHVKPRSPRRSAAQPKAAPVGPRKRRNLFGTKSEEWQACSRMRQRGGDAEKREDAEKKLGLPYRSVDYCDYGKEYKPSRRPFPGKPMLSKTAAKIATAFRSDKAIIPMMPFVREVRECSRTVESERASDPYEAKWSKKALVMLKYAIEDSLLKKCGNAWKIAVRNDRLTCSLHDFHIAKDIMELPLDKRAEYAETRA